MTDWPESDVIIGVAQVAVAIVLAILTKSLVKSTEAYSRQVERQTSIMEKNNALMEDAMKDAEKNAARERIFKKYERLKEEMDNFIAHLSSRVGDNQVFTKDAPMQKIVEWKGGQINDIKRETYAYWENYNRHRYLNQSKDLQRHLDNYFAAITSYHEVRSRSPQTEVDRAELKIVEESFERFRASLFDAITKRYSEVQKELEELEKELGIQET